LTVAFTGISHALGGLHFDFGKSVGGVEAATRLVFGERIHKQKTRSKAGLIV
jgi:hypothetical protein